MIPKGCDKVLSCGIVTEEFSTKNSKFEMAVIVVFHERSDTLKSSVRPPMSIFLNSSRKAFLHF